MKWSKLKQLIESRICDSLKKRIAIHSTAYGNCSCGHAWLTLDKEVIANFCTRAFWNTSPNYDETDKKFKAGQPTPEQEKKRKHLYTSYGELSRQDIYSSCWKYIHDYSIDESLKSDELIIKSLAVIDSRVGKKKVLAIQKEENLHPLLEKLIEERLKQSPNN